MMALSLPRDELSGDAPATTRPLAGGDVAARLAEVAPTVLRVARGLLSTDADAEDAAQESLLQIARALPSFRGDSSLRTFAVRITMRTALRMRRKTLAHEAKVSAFGTATVDPPQRDATLVEQQRALVWTLLDELAPAQAEALALRFVLGCSLPEIAETTGAPINTVRSRIRLAREALQRRLAQAPELRDALEPTR